jgi:sec-independent protein translocase protein TatA
MFSGNEWIIVVILAVLLFGGSQIPKLARSLGQAQKEFKKGISDGHDVEDTEIEPADRKSTGSSRRSTGK